MRVKNFVYTFKNALSSEICDQIIEYGLSQPMVKASTGVDTISTKRDSEVVWLYEPWILDLIMPYVERANKEAGWNFQWERVPQLQFTKYSEGQYYKWHRDTFMEPDEHGEIRKLSVTVNLNDTYEGGDMFFDPEVLYNKPHPVREKKLRFKGTICVFPADIWHKVEPITKGIRYSLVVWLTGNPWV